MLADYIADRIPELERVYPFEPGHLNALPCVTMLTRRYDAIQAETGPHDDMVYEFRVRLYVKLSTYEEAQNEIDDLIPIVLDVPRHHATMENSVDFLSMHDPGIEPGFSKEDGWAFKDLIAQMRRTEL